MKERSSTRGSHRGLIATATVVVFGASGLGLIGVALASQRTAPQPPITVTAPVHSPAAVSAPVARTKAPPRRTGALTLPRSKPVTLDIPAIDVHSVVRDLGRTPDGALQTPAPGPYYDDAAWYRHSPTPGSLGPAILMGHVDSARNGASVFFRLGELRPGDRVSVTRADDSVATFVVDEVHRYPKTDFPTDVVYGDIDHAGLRLLTCGGAFDDATGHYRDNIVVFASLAGTQHN